MKHFQHPLHRGEMENPDLVGVGGSLQRRRYIILFLRLDTPVNQADYRTVVTEARYVMEGCGAMIASVDIMAEIIIGHTLLECFDVNDATILTALGGLPRTKLHAVRIAVKSLRCALKCFRHKCADVSD